MNFNGVTLANMKGDATSEEVSNISEQNNEKKYVPMKQQKDTLDFEETIARKGYKRQADS